MTVIVAGQETAHGSSGTVDALAFREAMSRFGAAVHVAATDGPAGRFGATVSAVASVSDAPPTLLVCLSRRGRMNAAVKANGVFSINTLPAQGEALAIYRPEHGAPPIGEWLAEQITDERQQLTIVARYRDKGMQVAADDALALASDAALHGPPPRILLERAERSDLLAVLAFDNPADWHDDCREEGMDDVPQVSGKDSSCD